MIEKKNIVFIDNNPVDIVAEVNLIWDISNKLKNSYVPDNYGDVIIPMTILRCFECILEDTKDLVLKQIRKKFDTPPQELVKITGYQFYNTSPFNLSILCNNPDNMAEKLELYICMFSANVKSIMSELSFYTHIDKMAKNNCLFSIVKAFSELNLYPDNFDSVKMKYVFENLIYRSYQNTETGQLYNKCSIAYALSFLPSK